MKCSVCRFVLLFNFAGKYIFIETSVPRKVGDKALLMSPLFNKTSSAGKCFTFWYHMYGLSIGTLNIYVNITRATTGKQLVWTLSGNKGNRWFNGQVKVGTTIGTYQVNLLLLSVQLFEGVVFHLI